MKRILLGILTVAAVAACAPPAQTVGNSISVPIPATKAVHIDASGGRTTYSAGHGPASGSGLEKVRLLAPKVKVHGWVIIELGANDIAVEPRTEFYLSRVAQLVNAVPLDRCVAFMTVYRPAYQARANSWNASIRGVLAARPCYDVIEWHITAVAFPSYVSSDRLHMSAAGQRWYFNKLQAVAALPWGTKDA